MKHLVLFFSLFIIFSIVAYSQGDAEKALNFINIETLFSFDYNKPSNPDSKQLSIVRYVLQNTYENNIHKMRGEKDNQVFVREDGSEAVFDKD
jgi:hypothetical protein